MLVLVIDTAGSDGGVLLARFEGSPDSGLADVLGEGRLEPREFSRQLIPAIAELLQANRCDLADVDGFAVVSGPGSFTGLRVGLSAVKAMAEVMSKQIIALSRLAVMASAADEEQECDAAVVHALLDAGRGEFYHGIYRDCGRTCIGESLDTAASLAESIEGMPGVVVASEAIVVDAMSRLGSVNLRPVPPVSVRQMLPLVLWGWRARRFIDVALLDANYLRRLDVEGPRRVPVEAKFADDSASGS